MADEPVIVVYQNGRKTLDICRYNLTNMNWQINYWLCITRTDELAENLYSNTSYMAKESQHWINIVLDTVEPLLGRYNKHFHIPLQS